MENQFGNQPSTKEIEEMMTEEQKEKSEEREATFEAGYQAAEGIFYPEKPIADFINKIQKEYGHRDVEIDIGGDLYIGTLGSIYEGADYLKFYEKGDFKDMWSKPVSEREVKIPLKDIKAISIAGNRFKINKNEK